MKNYIVKTERLGLRNWEEADIKPMLDKLNNDPAVMEFYPALRDYEETETFVRRMQDHFSEKGFCYFAVDELETGNFIGFIGLLTQSYLSDRGDFVDIGWRLQQSAWGKGYATEGAKACLEFGFSTLKLDAIYSVCSTINVKSENVMKKIGMHKELVFDHPKLVDSPRLKECCVYRIDRKT